MYRSLTEKARELRPHSSVVTPPVREPVSVAEMRAHCRIDHTDEDETLAAYIVAARSWAELYCRRSFMTQTRAVSRQRWAEQMDLPGGPVTSVASITYVDPDGTTQTLASSSYSLVADGTMAYVVASNVLWPSTTEIGTPIRIEYVAGYGINSADVPATIRHAIKMLVAQMYEFREPIVTGTIVAALPMAIEALLYPYRVLGGYE